MSTVVATANVALLILAFAAAGLVVVFAVAVFVGRHLRDPDPVENALRLYRQHQLLAPHEDRPCSRCSQPTGWTWFGRPLCTTCRKREIEEAS